MCGIAGWGGPAASPGERPLRRMLGALVHRGPDAEGMVGGDGWGLGARRLAIIDLRTGDQPVRNESGTVHAVLNGEIYNYRELREWLTGRGHRLRSEGDTEVLAHLWEEEREALVSRLRGMFALAVVDATSRTLYLARDRVGKKPLYWTREGDRLWFASELKALRAALPDIGGVDEAALQSYLAFGFVPEEECIVPGVFRVPPATWLAMDLDSGTVRQRTYWHLDWRPDDGMTAAHAGSMLVDALDEAVALRLRADVPLAVFLSGGLDSGMVTALAARHGGTPAALCVTMQGGESELPLARATAAACGADVTQVQVDPADGAGLLPTLAEVFDEPLADPSVVPTTLVSRAAREHATVILTGDGGDEALAGYRRYLAAHVVSLPGGRGAVRALAPLMGGASRGRAGWGARLRAGLDGRAHPYLTWGPAKFGPVAAAELLGAPPRLPGSLTAALSATADLPLASQVRAADVAFFLPGDLLVKMDRASMAASLEARSPFLDHVVLERMARVPARILLRRLRTKALLREVARPYLPWRVQRAPKRGFEIPLRQWLEGSWRDEVRTVLESADAAIRHWIPAGRLSAWRMNRPERDPDRYARSLFTLITLEHWLRRWA